MAPATAQAELEQSTAKAEIGQASLAVIPKRIHYRHQALTPHGILKWRKFQFIQCQRKLMSMYMANGTDSSMCFEIDLWLGLIAQPQLKFPECALNVVKRSKGYGMEVGAGGRISLYGFRLTGLCPE